MKLGTSTSSILQCEEIGASGSTEELLQLARERKAYVKAQGYLKTAMLSNTWDRSFRLRRDRGSFLVLFPLAPQRGCIDPENRCRLLKRLGTGEDARNMFFFDRVE